MKSLIYARVSDRDGSGRSMIAPMDALGDDHASNHSFQTDVRSLVRSLIPEAPGDNAYFEMTSQYSSQAFEIGEDGSVTRLAGPRSGKTPKTTRST